MKKIIFILIMSLVFSFSANAESVEIKNVFGDTTLEHVYLEQYGNSTYLEFDMGLEMITVSNISFKLDNGNVIKFKPRKLVSPEFISHGYGAGEYYTYNTGAGGFSFRHHLNKKTIDILSENSVIEVTFEYKDIFGEKKIKKYNTDFSICGCLVWLDMRKNGNIKF